MKNGWMAPVLLLVGSAMAFAQTCPPGSSQCLVPGRPQTMTIGCAAPTAVLAESVTPVGTPTACANVSGDTACLANQLAAIQSELRMMRGMLIASSLEMRGQTLINRIDTLIAQETAFRQALAANPRLPGAQAQATALQARADMLDRDLAAFTREVSMLPADVRVTTAAGFSSFDQIYWTPALERLAAYNAHFRETACAAYQPAFAANPWLSPWVTTYSAALSTMNTNRQVYASARWWSNMQVLGTTETYPNLQNLPAGSMVYYVPAGSVVVLPPGATINTVAGATVMPMANTAACPPAGTTCPPTRIGTPDACPAPAAGNACAP
jgi:hypothetical protein